MKASDLPNTDLMMADPKFNPLLRVSEKEIDHVNELYAKLRRNSKQILKDAMEIGDHFIDFHERFGDLVKWGSWLSEKFPKIHIWTVERFIRLAKSRDFITTFMNDDTVPSIAECLRLISQRGKMGKPRVRAVVVRDDAEPHVQLEAKLKNYVISLYLLRYLEVEIKGMLESMDLMPNQVLKVLHYVCKEHHEVEEEVLRTFKPKPKVVPKDA